MIREILDDQSNLNKQKMIMFKLFIKKKFRTNYHRHTKANTSNIYTKSQLEYKSSIVAPNSYDCHSVLLP